MDLTKEEEEIHRKLKQILPHHIKTKTQRVDEYTDVEVLRKIYYELLEFAVSNCAMTSPGILYYLRRQIINGICKTKEAWIKLIAVLELTDITARDMPVFNQTRPLGDQPVPYVFCGTVGIKMPYLGGGSVIFRVASPDSVASSTSGAY